MSVITEEQMQPSENAFKIQSTDPARPGFNHHALEEFNVGFIPALYTLTGKTADGLREWKNILPEDIVPQKILAYYHSPCFVYTANCRESQLRMALTAVFGNTSDTYGSEYPINDVSISRGERALIQIMTEAGMPNHSFTYMLPEDFTTPEDTRGELLRCVHYKMINQNIKHEDPLSNPPDFLVNSFMERSFPLLLSEYIPYAIRGLYPFEHKARPKRSCRRPLLPYTTGYRVFDIPTVDKVQGIRLIAPFLTSRVGHKVLGNFLQHIFGPEYVDFMSSVLLNAVENVTINRDDLPPMVRRLWSCIDRFKGDDETSSESGNGSEYTIYNTQDASVSDRFPTSLPASNENPGVFRTRGSYRFGSLKGWGKMQAHMAQKITQWNNIATIEYLSVATVLRTLIRCYHKDRSESSAIRRAFMGVQWYPDAVSTSVKEHAQRLLLRSQYIVMYVEMFNELPPKEMLDKMHVKTLMNHEMQLKAYRLVFEQRWPMSWRYAFGYLHWASGIKPGIGNSELAADYIRILSLLYIEKNPHNCVLLLSMLMYNVSLCIDNESVCKLKGVWTWLAKTPYWEYRVRKYTMDRVRALSNIDGDVDNSNANEFYQNSIWSSAGARKLYKSCKEPDAVVKERVAENVNLVTDICKEFEEALGVTRELRRRVEVLKDFLQRMEPLKINTDGSGTYMCNNVKQLWEDLSEYWVWMGEFRGEDQRIFDISLLKLISVFPRMTPYNAMILMCKNFYEVQCLLMVNSVWSGYNTPYKVLSVNDVNKGIMSIMEPDAPVSTYYPTPNREDAGSISDAFQQLLNTRVLQLEVPAGLLLTSMFKQHLSAYCRAITYYTGLGFTLGSNSPMMDAVMKRKLQEATLFNFDSVTDAVTQIGVLFETDKTMGEYSKYLKSPLATHLDEFTAGLTIARLRLSVDTSERATACMLTGLLEKMKDYLGSVSSDPAKVKGRLDKSVGLNFTVAEFVEGITDEQSGHALKTEEV